MIFSSTRSSTARRKWPSCRESVTGLHCFAKLVKETHSGTYSLILAGLVLSRDVKCTGQGEYAETSS